MNVKPSAVASDFPALLSGQAALDKFEKEPVLSGLAVSTGRTARTLIPLQQQAWFPLVQLAPAAAFLGLWGWDRRRRFLERHPEVVLRRRARRALRRERRALRRAARAGDLKGFASATVSAMRVACAPHFPAEPRALVRADVLQFVGGIDGFVRNREIVCRFFAVTDANEFAIESPDASGLLRLQPEVERLLEELEAKL